MADAIQMIKISISQGCVNIVYKYQNKEQNIISKI